MRVPMLTFKVGAVRIHALRRRLVPHLVQKLVHHLDVFCALRHNVALRWRGTHCTSEAHMYEAGRRGGGCSALAYPRVQVDGGAVELAGQSLRRGGRHGLVLEPRKVQRPRPNAAVPDILRHTSGPARRPSLQPTTLGDT
jgi:hypothetical protein